MNIRELEGALTRLSAYNRLTKEMVTLEVAERELALYISPDSKKEVTAQLIIETVAEHYQIPVEHIISKKRNANIVKPRHIAMYILRTKFNLNLKTIGEFYGNRDHASVAHGVDKIESMLKDNNLAKNDIDFLLKNIEVPCGV